jgi:hypothetical protein
LHRCHARCWRCSRWRVRNSIAIAARHQRDNHRHRQARSRNRRQAALRRPRRQARQPRLPPSRRRRRAIKSRAIRHQRAQAPAKPDAAAPASTTTAAPRAIRTRANVCLSRARRHACAPMADSSPLARPRLTRTVVRTARAGCRARTTAVRAARRRQRPLRLAVISPISPTSPRRRGATVASRASLWGASAASGRRARCRRHAPLA